MTFKEYVDRDDLETEEEYQKLQDAYARMHRMNRYTPDKHTEKEMTEMRWRMKQLKQRLFMMNRREKPARAA
jgi:hypothetical protein